MINYDTDLTLADGTVVHQFTWTTENGQNFRCVEDNAYRINRWLDGSFVLLWNSYHMGTYDSLDEAIQAANRGPE